MKVTELTVAETARKLGVTLHHVYSLIWGGQIAAKRVDRQWRISADSVEARLKERGE